MKLNRKVAIFLAFISGVFSIAATAATLDQPRMRAAREDLTKAQTSLIQATTDKGGHRHKALEKVAEVIKEVDRGIESDRTH